MNDFSHKLYDILKKYPSFKLMGNVDAKVVKYELKNKSILVSIVDDIKPNCYTVSPYNMMISYSKDELVKVDSKIQKYFASALIYGFEFILKILKIDTVQTLNNYMFSTNFFDKGFKDIDIIELEKLAHENYPKHTMLVRSVNKVQNPKLYEKLQNSGWIALTSRQVYIFKDINICKKRQNYLRDKNLLNSDRYIFIELDINDFKLFEKAEELYNQLYLKKYSQHNIHFKALYLKELQQQKLIHLRLLYDCMEDKYVGVVGLVGEDGVITAPIIGYDNSYDIKEALYRRLIAYAMEYAMQRKYLLNLSSGASNFKVMRGAEACLEYMFVNVKHLSSFKKIIWKILSLIANYFYAPLLKRLKL
ncbi:hypothetical protein [Sulfurimonas sp.]|uniref:hypothetical protein n=1 Tax=Sulfurimonas sp. TaxID=2022749 RepID=UPI00260ABF33|nr:hypothetical protein [Sulfurimonas sp.]MCW8895466.1 hypothetical protein [Sulfurimonas sp.]